MASSGPLYPATTADDSSIGTRTWSSPNNAQADDSSYASASNLAAAADSHYLKCTNYSFSIPSGATINGIVVEVKKGAAGVGDVVLDKAIRLVKGGTIQTTDKSSGSNWSDSSHVYATYGSSSDLWGATWTDTDINASNFGAAIAATLSSSHATAEVDAVRITVYYTVAGAADSGFFLVM